MTISDAIHKADNQDRINFNKLKAKQLSLQISFTTQDLQSVCDDGDDSMSDIETVKDGDELKRRKWKQPTKRALVPDFNASTSKQTTKPSSPVSTISEYYTVQRDVFQPAENQQQFH